VHPHERQSPRGCLGREQPPVPGREQLCHAVGGSLAASDVGEHAADRPHHPAQESVAAKEGADLFPRFLDCEGVENAHARVLRRAPHGEYGKIAPAGQGGRGLSHLLGIGTRRDRGDEGRLARGKHGSAAPAVEILLPGRIPAGVKVGGGRSDGEQPRIPGEKRIDPFADAERVHRPRQIEVHDLSVGVDSRVRAPGGDGAHRQPREALERLLQNCLHRPRRIFLNLPAGKISSDIRENGAVTRGARHAVPAAAAGREPRSVQRSSTAKGMYSAARTIAGLTPGTG
jgi:hypothetical protein